MSAKTFSDTTKRANFLKVLGPYRQEHFSDKPQIMSRRTKSVHHDTARIPLTLQSIFLNGSRGVVVNTPPPGNVAMKKFRRWRWHTNDVKLSSAAVTEVGKTSGPECEPKEKKVKKKRVSEN
jgi:hypothetical protein